MSMRALEDLRETLCEELEEIARKPEMGAGDLELAHKLTDTIKNIDKICMLEDGGYSRDGDWEARGNYGRGSSYGGDDGYSGRRGGNRGGGRRRDSMGRYSRDGGRESMMEHLEQMMDEAGSDKEREAIRRCMSELKNA